MTVDQATYAAILAMDGVPASRIDRFRARMSAKRSVQNLQRARAHGERQPQNSRLHLLADTSDVRPARRLHPGDVVFWTACFGAACLLLICAIT